jgi:integrase
VIKNALKWGSKATRGFLKANPALDWEMKKPVTPKRRMYNAAEVEKMEAGVRDCLKPIVTTLAWTGMRIGELVNLRWKDVDFDEHVLHIRVQEKWKPKGRRDRTVPMLPKVEAVVRQQRVGEYVFGSLRGGRVNDSNTLQALKKDQIALGMPEGDQHAFRRFFATTMMINGTDPHTVMQWGGWQSLETMLRYLADTNVKDSVRAMDQVAKRLATA